MGEQGRKIGALGRKRVRRRTGSREERGNGVGNSGYKGRRGKWGIIKREKRGNREGKQ